MRWLPSSYQGFAGGAGVAECMAFLRLSIQEGRSLAASRLLPCLAPCERMARELDERPDQGGRSSRTPPLRSLSWFCVSACFSGTDW